MTRYLVIGIATAETVTHQETNRDRRDVVGVAGQTAIAMARDGQHVTLLTSTGERAVAHHTFHTRCPADAPRPDRDDHPPTAGSGPPKPTCPTDAPRRRCHGRHGTGSTVSTTVSSTSSSC